MSDFGEAVSFAPPVDASTGRPLAELSGHKGVWPCIYFDSLAAFESSRDTLLELLPIQEDQRADFSAQIQQELTEVQEAETNTSTPSNDENRKLVFFLGEVLPPAPTAIKRLQWTNWAFLPFEEARAMAHESIIKLPRFRDAVNKHALRFKYGPEFSPTRLRFHCLRNEGNENAPSDVSNDGKVTMWPCMLFDNVKDLLFGLARRGLESEHRKQMDILLQESELLAEGSEPPHVYFFDEKKEYVGHYIDVFDHSYLDFQANLYGATKELLTGGERSERAKEARLGAIFQAMNVTNSDTFQALPAIKPLLRPLLSGFEKADGESSSRKKRKTRDNNAATATPSENAAAGGVETQAVQTTGVETVLDPVGPMHGVNPVARDPSLRNRRGVQGEILRVDLNQKVCDRCQGRRSTSGGKQRHDATCAYSTTGYIAPPIEILRSLRREDYDKLSSRVKNRWEMEGLNAHLTFSGRDLNQVEAPDRTESSTANSSSG